MKLENQAKLLADFQESVPAQKGDYFGLQKKRKLYGGRNRERGRERQLDRERDREGRRERQTEREKGERESDTPTKKEVRRIGR